MNVPDLQVSRDHYFNGYDSRLRFVSYWSQIEETLNTGAKSVVEIGVGNRLVSDYLTRMGMSVTSVDIDPDLDPDVVASITDLPFEDGSFDTAVACEVLEHIPYEDACQALRELRRIATNAVISVPNSGRYWEFSMLLPKKSHVNKRIELPWLMRRRSVRVPSQHYWELEIEGYPTSRFRDSISEAGWTIRKEFRVPWYAFHHFFVLG